MTASHRNLQTEVTECGLASLAMAAAMAGSEIDLAWLRQRFQSSGRGSNLQELSDIAAAIGFTARAVRCEPDELSQLQRPAILHWAMRHFVVLDRVRAKSVRIFDPASGYREVSRKELGEHFTGVALELTPSPNFQRKADKSPLRLTSLFQWTPEVKSGLLQALVLSLVLQAYVVASPFFMQLAIDEAALKGDRPFLTAIAWGFAIFAVFNGLAELLRGVVLQAISSRLNWDMSRRLFHHMIRLPLPWFQRRRLADAMSRFQSLDPVRSVVANGLIGAVLDGVLSVITAVMMFIFAPSLAAVTLASFAFYAVIRLVALPITRRYSAQALTASIAEQGKRIETLRAIQTIKVMSSEAKRESDWANKFAALVSTNQSNALATTAFSVVQHLADAIANVLIVYLGVVAIMDGKITVGVLYAFMAYRTQFMARAINIFEQAVNWQMLDIYTHRLADVVLTPQEPDIDSAPSGLPAMVGAFDMDRVSFRYGPAEKFVLRDISLKIAPGEFVAIVGPSGSGKSTLLKVLVGLYAPTLGEVRLDGMLLMAWGAKQVRSAIGVVMQDDELLPGSIAENVSFFDDELDDAWMWECLRLAALADEVKAMPMRAETFVGDMGSMLSGGQKQRILLARALYRRPKILLLDEATSHLDIESERKINESLKALKITRVIVAHRPETIRAADRVVHIGGRTMTISPGQLLPAKVD